MHAVSLLQKITKKSCPKVHAKRLKCLFEVVASLTGCSKLWISALGRNVRNASSAKHNIKKVDGLVGNKNLHAERLIYYTMITRKLLSNKKHPIIDVDWSSTSASCAYYILRASVSTDKKRAFTIYEEIHPEENHASCKVHKAFLETLKQVLPQGCCPIIVTDAGFRNPWFKLIYAIGWDFVGRLRHNTQVKTELSSNWQSVTNLHCLAKGTPQYLGSTLVAKSNPLKMNMYTVKGKQKNRIKKTKQGKKCQSSNSKQYTKSAKEPWILVTSLAHGRSAAKRVVNLYKLRMQIEQGFRDIKDKRNGFRLHESGTQGIKRLENLLLIALLTTFSIWLAGMVAIHNNWHYQLQSNTVRKRSVLSIFFIGIHVLKGFYLNHLTQSRLLEAVGLLQKSIVDGAQL